MTLLFLSRFWFSSHSYFYEIF